MYNFVQSLSWVLSYCSINIFNWFSCSIFRPLGFSRPVEALDQGTLPPPISKFKGSHPFKNTGIPEFYEKISQNGDPNKGRSRVPFWMNFRKTMLRFFREARKFATKFIRIGVTPPPFSENSSFLPPQNYRKNRNEIFWIGNDPPPSEVFRKFIQNGKHGLP